MNIPLTQEMSESQNYNIDERLEFMVSQLNLLSLSVFANNSVADICKSVGYIKLSFIF